MAAAPPATTPALPPLEIDEDLGERFYRDDRAQEERHTDAIIEVIRRSIDEQARKTDGRARRDAHAFDNGCVRATFRIDANLAPELSQGVFVPGREYKAWIRFSNGNIIHGSSRAPDARGMAIKLMGVEGPKLLDDEKHTQDFILISHPRFFVDDLVPYQATLEKFLKGDFWNQWIISPLKLGSLRSILIALRVNGLLIANPLFIQYWSMTPYRLGADRAIRMAVKYTVKPPAAARRGLGRRLATFFSPGFSLKGEIAKSLVAKGTTFDFYIQRFADDARTPIEDSTVEWLESAAPLEHVATIAIPPQDIMSAAQAEFCDNLSYSPWHGLAEHRPLGLVNRVRRKVYLAISNHRHAFNRVAPREPNGDESFARGGAGGNDTA
jgi:hypothetical protein